MCKSKRRYHYNFYGQVQAVGFRYTMLRAAREIGVTGWVRNCCDGSVEAEAQGTPEQLEALQYRMENHGWIRIEHTEKQEIGTKPELGFTIRH